MADIKSVPAATSGVSASSSTTAWSFGSWVQITSGLSVGLKVIGIQFQESQNNPPLDTTIERLFEIGIGASGSEVTKLQIPSSVRSDTTAYGHYQPPVNKIWLPEPYLINANTRIAVRVADSTTTQVTYNAIKLIYEENLPPSVVLNSPANNATTSTTPTLNFTGTDPDSDKVEYEVQISTNSAFDITKSTVSSHQVSGGNPTVSTTVTSENLLIAIVTTQDSNTNNLGAESVIRNGQNFTKIAHYGGSGGSGPPVNIEIWYLANPSTGTYNTVANCSGVINNCALIVYPLANCDTSNPIDAYTGNSGSGTPSNVSVNSNTHYCYIISGLVSETTISGVGSGQDSDASLTDQPFENTRATSKLGGLAGSQTMSFTAGSASHAWMTVAIKRSNSVVVNAFSASDTGFTSGHPFTSGTAIDYTVQSPLSAATYYWRVRAIDPSGSNTWGGWSSTRSFTAQAETTTSDNRSARTKGQTTTSNTRNARTKGLSTASDTRNARTKGAAKASDTRNTRIKGIATTSNNRNARTKGVSTASDIRNARAKGVATILNNRSAITKGSLTTSDTRGARSKGKEILTDNRSARTKGYSTVTNNLSARTLGYLASLDSRNARTKGVSISSNTRNAKIKGWATTSDTRAAKTKGVIISVISDNRNARTKGLDTLSNNRSARTKGFDIAKDTRNARIKGYLTTSDTRDARIKGKSTASDFRNVHIKGSATTSDTRGARLIGAIASYRNAKVKGPEPNYPKFIFVDGKLAIRLLGKFYHKV